MPEVGGGNIDYDRYKYVPDPEKQELPKDERDKKVAARKAAHEAKKAGERRRIRTIRLILIES